MPGGHVLDRRPRDARVVILIRMIVRAATVGAATVAQPRGERGPLPAGPSLVDMEMTDVAVVHLDETHAPHASRTANDPGDTTRRARGPNLMDDPRGGPADATAYRHVGSSHSEPPHRSARSR
jgi:hypothetical protein